MYLYLNTEYPEYEEEGTANDNDVAKRENFIKLTK